jgi:hypothetical protein
MSTPCDIEQRLAQLQDSVDSLHHRMDRFYSWAGLLQQEFRNMKQRTGFIEGLVHDKFDFTQNQPPVASHNGSEKVFGGEDDNALWARMMRITGKNNEG